MIKLNNNEIRVKVSWLYLKAIFNSSITGFIFSNRKNINDVQNTIKPKQFKFLPNRTKTPPETTVYISYAHNYFGASEKLIKTNKSSNSTAVSNHNDLAEESRSKRGVLQLYNMLVCATGCNPVSYKGYGCYCGFLGSGYAVDGIDECCQMHDWCYSTVKCPILSVYFVPYLWYCYRYQPHCVYDDDHEWSMTKACGQRLCECDRALSMCLQKYSCPRDHAMCYSSPWRLFQNAIMG